MTDLSERRRDLIRNANTQIIEHGDLSLIDGMFSQSYVAHAGKAEYRGHAFLRQFTLQLRTAIPDIHIVEVKILAEADETITWQRTLAGTHSADMMGIPPSNQPVEWTEMIVSRFEGETIAEDWLVSDLAGQLFARQ